MERKLFNWELQEWVAIGDDMPLNDATLVPFIPPGYMDMYRRNRADMGAYDALMAVLERHTYDQNPGAEGNSDFTNFEGVGVYLFFLRNERTKEEEQFIDNRRLLIQRNGKDEVVQASEPIVVIGREPLQAMLKAQELALAHGAPVHIYRYERVPGSLIIDPSAEAPPTEETPIQRGDWSRR